MTQVLDDSGASDTLADADFSVPSIPLDTVVSSVPQRDGAHEMPFGALLLAEGGVKFRLWAPTHESMHIAVDGQPAVAMDSIEEGWHEKIFSNAGPGTRYEYVLPDGTAVPDPASKFQPDDVHGLSEVIDPASYQWRTTFWESRPWHESVIYEIHVGTFTPAGTFRAAVGRLDYLQDLGVTAVEIMPVADFPGARSWGYDGVLLYAPDCAYGRPEDFKAFIDAAHQRGIQVFLDVVYNHFGPDGNYLPAYAANFFTERHKTPWGAAINFDGVHSAAVREFIIHNALYWLEEYRIDGLRLDAVHAIIDDSAQHVIKELAQRARALRPAVKLILENERNDVSLLMRKADGRPRHFTAQWNDDVHHVLHTAATGESQAYYGDYAGDTEKLGRALAEGFAFQGDFMHALGAPRGEPSAMLIPGAFVAFIQNHDQIGNRPFGERIGALVSAEALRALAAVYLLLPQVPMLFMGEEWGAKQPFLFFTNFGGELAEKIRDGRREEFKVLPEFQNDALRARIPDPEAQATFNASKLQWSELSDPKHAFLHDHYRRLLQARAEFITPLLPTLEAHAGSYRVVGTGAVVVEWRHGHGTLRLAVNLSSEKTAGFPLSEGRIVWREGNASEGQLDPWSLEWSVRELKS